MLVSFCFTVLTKKVFYRHQSPSFWICSISYVLYKLSVYHSNVQTSQLTDTSFGRNTTIIQKGLSNIVHSCFKHSNYSAT